jgi:hypothetical protein
MKIFLTAGALVLAFMVGTCSPVSEVVADQTEYPLTLWDKNNYGEIETMVLSDEVTGVHYIVVNSDTYHGGGITITPRLNADGSLFVNK